MLLAEGGDGDDGGDRGDGSDGSDGDDGVDVGDKGDKGDKGDVVVKLTRGRYPTSYLECLSHQDSENIAHC